VDLYLHNTDVWLGRGCYKAVFSLLPLAYQAVFLLARALGIGFVHPAFQTALDGFSGRRARCTRLLKAISLFSNPF
jgi:hypothetical protein